MSHASLMCVESDVRFNFIEKIKRMKKAVAFGFLFQDNSNTMILFCLFQEAVVAAVIIYKFFYLEKLIFWLCLMFVYMPPWPNHLGNSNNFNFILGGSRGGSSFGGRGNYLCLKVFSITLIKCYPILGGRGGGFSRGGGRGKFFFLQNLDILTFFFL